MVDDCVVVCKRICAIFYVAPNCAFDGYTFQGRRLQKGNCCSVLGRIVWHNFRISDITHLDYDSRMEIGFLGTCCAWCRNAGIVEQILSGHRWSAGRGKDGKCEKRQCAFAASAYVGNYVGYCPAGCTERWCYHMDAYLYLRCVQV